MDQKSDGLEMAKNDKVTTTYLIPGQRYGEQKREEKWESMKEKGKESNKREEGLKIEAVYREETMKVMDSVRGRVIRNLRILVGNREVVVKGDEKVEKRGIRVGVKYKEVEKRGDYINERFKKSKEAGMVLKLVDKRNRVIGLLRIARKEKKGGGEKGLKEVKKGPAVRGIGFILVGRTKEWMIKKIRKIAKRSRILSGGKEDKGKRRSHYREFISKLRVWGKKPENQLYLEIDFDFIGIKVEKRGMVELLGRKRKGIKKIKEKDGAEGRSKKIGEGKGKGEEIGYKKVGKSD
jgi:hypothetical protein